VLLTCRHGAVTARTATINQLKALVVSAPAQLRGQLAGVDGEELVWVCARLRGHPTRPIEHTATVRALRSTARRILALQTEVDEVGGQLERLVAATVPALLEVVGIGPVVAAQLLVSWSHPGRCAQRPRSALAGAAPIPASSGKTVRYRLNRSGDRQRNRALHTIVLARRAHHPRPGPTSPVAPPRARPARRSTGA
jgi:hypothetical protein